MSTSEGVRGLSRVVASLSTQRTAAVESKAADGGEKGRGSERERERVSVSVRVR